MSQIKPAIVRTEFNPKEISGNDDTKRGAGLRSMQFMPPKFSFYFSFIARTVFIIVLSCSYAFAAEDYLSLVINAEDYNNETAQHTLGKMFLEGDGVKADPVTAKKWFEKAVAQNHTPSIFELATMYKDGVGTSADKKKAAQLFRKAAEQGHSKSKSAYVQLLIASDLYKEDPDNAFEWLLGVAESGDGDAQFAIGDMYQNGLGVKRSIGKARDWYRKAAKNGHQRAQLRLDGCANC